MSYGTAGFQKRRVPRWIWSIRLTLKRNWAPPEEEIQRMRGIPREGESLLLTLRWRRQCVKECGWPLGDEGGHWLKPARNWDVCPKTTRNWIIMHLHQLERRCQAPDESEPHGHLDVGLRRMQAAGPRLLTYRSGSEQLNAVLSY